MADSASLPDRSECFLCCYINATSQIQLVQQISAFGDDSEQVVFPGQRWLFEALPNAWLEVSSAAHPSPERISCQSLQVKERYSPALAIFDSVGE